MFRVWLKQSAELPTYVFLDPDLPLEWREEVQNKITHIAGVETGEERKSSYVIRMLKGALILTRPGEYFPLFKRVKVGNSVPYAVKTFLLDVRDVVKWGKVLQQHNSTSKLDPDCLTVEVFNFAKYDIESNEIVSECLNNPKEPIELSYFYHKGSLEKPPYQLKVTNENKSVSLWVSAVMLDSDFKITNRFLQKQELQPGQSVWMSYVKPSGEQKKRFRSFVNPEYLSFGIQQISDYIKVYASVSELNTDSFVQESIPLDTQRTVRSALRSAGITETEEPFEDDWMVKTIELRTTIPMPEFAFSSDELGENSCVSCLGPDGFDGKVSLANLNKLMKIMKVPLPSDLWDSNHQRILALTPQIGLPNSLDALEFFALEGADKVSSKTPLKIRFLEPLSGLNNVKAFGFFPASNTFEQIGGQQPNGDVWIERLPAASITYQRSDEISVKVFFTQVL